MLREQHAQTSLHLHSSALPQPMGHWPTFLQWLTDVRVDKGHVLQKQGFAPWPSWQTHGVVLPPSGSNGFPSSIYHKILKDKHIFPVPLVKAFKDISMRSQADLTDNATETCDCIQQGILPTLQNSLEKSPYKQATVAINK